MREKLETHLRKRGMAMWIVVVFMAVGLAMASVAVDYGRVQLGKTQLRMAADSAARAAVTQVGYSITGVQDLAYNIANANKCDGTSIAIDKNADVEFLDWNTTNRTFTVLTGTSRLNANAVRVTCKREGTSGIPLTFAWMAGTYFCNAHGVAIAAVTPPEFGMVGLDYIRMNGNSAASYWSSTGIFAGNSGNIASNGNITSSSPANIKGYVWALSGATVTNISAFARRTLPAPLSYPNASSGSYNLTTNDNALLPAGLVNPSSKNFNTGNSNYNIPAGNYVVNQFAIGANGSLNLLGPVTFYIYGNVVFSGNALTNGSIPKNMKLVLIPHPTTGAAPGTVNIASGGALYADIYAPQSAITLSGNGAIYGTVIGKSIDMTGSSDIYYDLSVTTGGSVSVVK